MIEGIHDHGYWLVDDYRRYFDEPLTKGIAELARNWGSKSILDVGCGGGYYTVYLRGAGFWVEGYDGNPNTPKLTAKVCGVMDFAVDVDMPKVDLVLCLEVAEHIPREKEIVFLNNITKARPPNMILSWAVKGQGGFGHFNCRNNDYVINKLDKLGYSFLPEETMMLRGLASLRWFKRTVMVFKIK